MQFKKFLFPEAKVFIKYANNSSHVVLASEEGMIKIFKHGLSATPKTTDDINDVEDDPVEIELDSEIQINVIDVSDEFIGFGTSDNKVILHSLSDGLFERICTRFNLPVSSLAFTKNGHSIISGSVDHCLKIVGIKEVAIMTNTANADHGAIASPFSKRMGTKTIDQNSAPVSCIASDPLLQYFAALSTDSSCKIYDLSKTDSPVASLNLTTTSVIAPIITDLQWEPATGSILTVISGRILLGFGRAIWDKATIIEHIEELKLHRWSKNGELIAFLDSRNFIYIYSPSQRQNISKMKPMLEYEASITDLAWTSNGSHIGFVDNMGSWYELPIEYNIPTGNHNTTNISSSLSHIIEDSTKLGAGHSVKRSKLVKNNKPTSIDNSRSLIINSAEDTSGSDMDEIQINNSSRKASKREIEDDFFELENELEDLNDFIDDEEEFNKTNKGLKKFDLDSNKLTFEYQQQPAIQACATPFDSHNRRFMGINEIGFIISRQDGDGSQHIDIEFRDMAMHTPVSFMEVEIYNLGSLGHFGAVFATSTRIFYKHFNAWSAESDWSILLTNGEEVVCINTSGEYVCIGTSMNRLRVFTLSGIQKLSCSLPGSIVTITANNTSVFVYFNNHQQQGVSYSSLDLSELSATKSKPVSTTNYYNVSEEVKVPLSPGSILVWAGHADVLGRPVIIDSKGFVQLRTFIGNLHVWTHILDIKAREKRDNLRYWCYAVSSNKLQVVYFKNVQYPQVLPRPGLSTLEFESPYLLNSNPETYKHETDIFLHGIAYNHNLQHTSMLTHNELSRLSAQNDISIIKTIHEYIKQGKDMRAVDQSRSLKLVKSFNYIIDLAQKAKNMSLIDRFTVVKKARAEEVDEESKNEKTSNQDSNQYRNANFEAEVQRLKNDNNELREYCSALAQQINELKSQFTGITNRAATYSENVEENQSMTNRDNAMVPSITTPVKSSTVNPFKARPSPNVQLIKKFDFVNNTLH